MLVFSHTEQIGLFIQLNLIRFLVEARPGGISPAANLGFPIVQCGVFAIVFIAALNLTICSNIGVLRRDVRTAFRVDVYHR